MTEFDIILMAVVQGITEFLSNKVRGKDDAVMLIYNKELSVSPITTHIPLGQVSKK